MEIHHSSVVMLILLIVFAVAAVFLSIIEAVLDRVALSHVGFTDDGRPMVIPMIHARIGETIYLHGAKATRIVKRLGASVPVCLTATLLDGLVLARSAFHHSMNYRSVVIYGIAEELSDPAEKHAQKLTGETRRILFVEDEQLDEDQ